MKRTWRGMVVLTVAFLVATPPVTAQTPEPDGTIIIQTFQFRPQSVEIRAGTRMIWVNQDDIRHTVTSGTPEARDSRFDAQLAGKGTRFNFTFTQPGTFSYFCNRHQHMRGEIHVK